MRRLSYLDEARDDLREIAAYIATATGSRAVAQHFIATLRAKCRHIAELAGTHGTDRSQLGAEIRSTPIGRYIILFRYTGDAVEIVNVLHASRDVTTYYSEPETES